VGVGTGGTGTSTGAGVITMLLSVGNGVIGGCVSTGGLSVGNGVIGGCVSTGGSVSGGRDTPGVGASVLFVPASANAMVTSATMNASDDFMLFRCYYNWRMAL